MINPHWLEVRLSRTNFHSPKGVRAIEVLLYIDSHSKKVYLFVCSNLQPPDPSVSTYVFRCSHSSSLLWVSIHYPT